MKNKREASDGRMLLSTAATLLLLLFSTTFFLRMTGNMVQTTIPLFAESYLGMNTAEVGIVSALFLLAGVFSPLLIVTRVNIDSLDKSLVLFSAFFAATIPLFYLVGNQIEFLLLIVCSSVASSTVMPLMLTNAQTLRGGSAQRNIGFYTVALSSSLVAGPFLEGFSAQSFGGLKPVFLVFFPFVAISVVLLALRHWRGNGKDGSDRPATIQAATARTRMTFSNVRDVLVSGSFLVPTVGQLSYSIVFAGILSFGGLLAEEKINAGYGLVFYLFGIFFTTSWIVRVLLTIMPDIRNKIRLLHASAVLSVSGLLLAGAASSTTTMFATFALLGVPHGLQYPVSTMLIAERIERKDLPVANALFTSVGAIAMAATPVAIGYLSVRTGLSDALVLLVIPVLALWSFFYLLSKRDGRTNPVDL